MKTELEKIRDEIAWSSAMEVCRKLGIGPSSSTYSSVHLEAKNIFDAAVRVMSEKVERLEQENKVMREALEFYADDDNEDMNLFIEKMTLDEGVVAIEALTFLKENT